MADQVASSFKQKTRLAMSNDLFENKSRHIDTRPLYVRAISLIPCILDVLYFLAALAVLFLPTYSYFIFIVFLFFCIYAVSVQFDYLISAPTFAKGNGWMPEDGRNKKKNDLKAYLLIGYDLLFGRQMWIPIDRETRMSLIAGTTGSGKTVTQNAQLYQTCIQGHLKYGAPMLLFDGKGSIAGLYDFLFYIVRAGRIHDLRILNFLTGGFTQDTKAMLDDDWSSNKFQPFSILNKEESRGLIMSFGRSSEGGNSDFFRDRANTMLAGVFSVLCWRRDELGEPLDAAVIQRFIELRNMFRLASDSTMPMHVLKPLREYLKTLNAVEDAHFSMDVDQGFEINTKAEEQHTYNRSMLSKTINEMVESLGHIFCSTGSDINLRNAISHGQIVIVLLPTIEKEPDAMAELGRMMVGSLRPALAPLLGFKVQGTKLEVCDSLPSNRIIPVRISMDEVLNYYTRGISNFLSLLRSSHVAITLLGQSLKGIYDSGESEGRQSLANLNNKYMFSTQDVYETMEVISKSVGSIVSTQLGELQANNTFGWRNADRLQLSKEELIDARDMAAADPMEGLYIFRGSVTPFKSATFFPDDKRDGTLDYFKLNIFAELLSPSEEDVERVKSLLNASHQIKANNLNKIDETESSNAVIKAFTDTLDSNLNAAKKIGSQYRHLLHIMTYTLVDELLLDQEEAFGSAIDELEQTSKLKHETGNVDVDVRHVITQNINDVIIDEPTDDDYSEFSGLSYQGSVDEDMEQQEEPKAETLSATSNEDNQFVEEVEDDLTPEAIMKRNASSLGLSVESVSEFPLINDDEEESAVGKPQPLNDGRDNVTYSAEVNEEFDFSYDSTSEIDDDYLAYFSEKPESSKPIHTENKEMSLSHLLLSGDELEAHLDNTSLPFGRSIEVVEEDSSDSDNHDELAESSDTSANESNNESSSSGGPQSALAISETINQLFSEGEQVTGLNFQEIKEAYIAPSSYIDKPVLNSLTDDDAKQYIETVHSTITTTENSIADDLLNNMFD
ncbi:hypothetical protein ACTFQF_00825 [Aliivibrio fischeri]|uniref:hypothetical protein n=1 Tax=Aliivibrio fischeri TaxID=668 RepID=UPI0007C49B69|nr:hypothetical protein [Aliivibrio fischeri]